MDSITAGKDRREHERYEVDSGGFALIRSDDTEVLGSIQDISAGGLSLSHIDDSGNIPELSSLAIDLISEKLCAEHFNGKSIWSKSVEDEVSTAMVKMKCCGIQFEQLDNELRLQLLNFIESLSIKASK